MTDEYWSRISSRIKAVFNMGMERSKWLDNCSTAKFIASIPVIAGCNKSDITSFSNLAIYIMSIDESTKEMYFHSSEDDSDIYLRLAPINNYIGGDKRILQCCMDLLALTMLCNYNNDRLKDKSIGKYNPLNDGKWEYTVLAERLKASITANITAGIEEYYSLDKAQTGSWKN